MCSAVIGKAKAGVVLSSHETQIFNFRIILVFVLISCQC